MPKRDFINLGQGGCLCWETATYSPECCDEDDPKAEGIGRTRGPFVPEPETEEPPPPPPPEDEPEIILNHRMSNPIDYSAITPFMSQVEYLRFPGGTFGMQATDANFSDAHIQDLAAFQDLHNLKGIWMLNMNDPPLNQLALVNRFKSLGATINIIEFGNEMSHKRFREGDTSHPDVTKAITPEIYVEDVGFYKAELDVLGLPYLIQGAKRDNDGAGLLNQYKNHWNDTVKAYMIGKPEIIGLTIHQYVDKDDEVAGSELIRFYGYFADFEGYQLWFTEAGSFSTNLDDHESFWTELYAAKKPTDLFGLHVLYNTNQPHPHALFSASGISPIGTRFQDWANRLTEVE